MGEAVQEQLHVAATGRPSPVAIGQENNLSSMQEFIAPSWQDLKTPSIGSRRLRASSSTSLRNAEDQQRRECTVGEKTSSRAALEGSARRTAQPSQRSQRQTPAP